MFHRIVVVLVSGMLALPAMAAELVMVEQLGCVYCEMWDDEIAPIYPKTAEGKSAPLRRIDLHDAYPADLNFTAPVMFTPTFILVEDGQELARIEGYPGEGFFWWALEQMVQEHVTKPGES